MRDVRNDVLLIRVSATDFESELKAWLAIEPYDTWIFHEHDYDDSDSDIENGEAEENSSRLPVEYTEVDVIAKIHILRVEQFLDTLLHF
jgi:hypothetical protein